MKSYGFRVGPKSKDWCPYKGKEGEIWTPRDTERAT